MEVLESSRHLFQRPQYSCDQKNWNLDFESTVKVSAELKYDVAAILSILSFNYACGERTLFQEIRRTPWLSTTDSQGHVTLEDIPPHGFRWDRSEQIAEKMFSSPENARET